jgi:PAS domain S-box-containing protein
LDKFLQNNFATDFNLLFDAINEAILIIDPLDEIILDANKSAIDIFGYQKSEFLGKSLSVLCKDIETERKQINNILSTGDKIDFKSIRITSQNQELWFDVNSFLIIHKEKQAILQLCNNITNKKASENALIESENKYRALYENHPLILITSDINKKVLSINKNGAAELSYEVKDLIGSDLSKLFSSKEFERLDKQINDVLNNAGKPSPHEMVMVKKNKQEFWVRETIYASIPKDSDPQIFLVCDNITYQKNAEAEAKNLANSLQNMLDASPLGVLVYRLNEEDELILISTNQSAVNILQIDLYSLISQKVQDIFPALVQEGLLEKFKVVIKTGYPFRNQAINYKDLHFSGIYEFSAMRLTSNTLAVFFTNITEKQRALEALISSEIKYKTLFESANDAIFLMKDDKFIDCNIKATELFGRKKEDLIGYTPQQFSPEYQPDGKLSSVNALKKITSALNDKPQFFEWIHLRPDKSTFYVEVSLNKIEIHKESYLQSIVRDITERKTSERIINEQRRELATLLSNLPGMAYRCLNNANWTMKFISEGCLDLTGYPPDYLLNDKVISYNQLINKEDQLQVKESIDIALSKKESFTLLYRITASTGDEKWVWEKGRGIYDDRGELLYLEGFITDITERKISEERIKILAHALTSVTECVIITDLRDRIKFINKSFSRAYGYEQKELFDKHISVIRSEKNDPEIVKKIWPETLAGGWTGELINVRKDGEEFLIHLSTSLVINEIGRPIAITGVIFEITNKDK